MPVTAEHPLAPLCKLWLSLMEKANEHKWSVFGKTAHECWQFFDGAHDFMYKNALESTGMYADGQEAPKTTFKMTMNKVAELVQLFGPTMYYKNPYRQANPQKPEVPPLAFQMLAQQVAAQMAQGGMAQMGAVNPAQAQAYQQQIQQQVAGQFQQQLQMTLTRDEAVAELLQWVLNFLPNELDLKSESRLAIDEALVKGRGVLLHEMYQPPESMITVPRTSWVSVDDYLVDPDAPSLKEATWVAIRCQHPYWQVEREYGLEPGALERAANLESLTQQSVTENMKLGSHYRRRGDTHDLVTYYKVWTKCGLGQRLTLNRDKMLGGEVAPLQEALEQFGDYGFMVVADGIDYPLNLPPELMDVDVEQPGVMQEVKKRLAWPVPFYKDNEWPATELDFHPLPGQPWPQAHMKPALGELRFLNWAMSFLAGRIRITSRVFIALAEHLDEDIKNDIEHGGDLTILPLKMNVNKQINEVIQFLQHPEVNKDIWTIIDAVMTLFDKRVGLTELLYGISGKQMRSAKEADVKEERTNVRPDDMAERVEHWQTRVARKEAQMLRLFCGPQAVAPIFGEEFNPQQMQFGVLTQLWSQYVYLPLDGGPQNVERVFREFEYRIEAGSIRKPNVERDQSNMDQAMQVLFTPLYQHYSMTGDPTQINAFLTDWAKTRQLDASDYLFQPFPVQPPPPAGGGQQPQQPQQQAA